MNFRRWCKVLGLAMLAWCAGTQGARADLITTMPSWPNTHPYILPFGESNTATYGQTITVGADTRLTNFTFQMRTERFPGPSVFAGYVMQWDSVNNRATGPVLFTSSTQSRSAGDADFSPVSINPNINLVSGLQYVLFLSASNFFDTIGDQADFGWIDSGSVYGSGQFVFQNNGSTFGDLSSQTWSSFGGLDLAFSANLERLDPAAPAPAGLALAGIGSICCVFFARRRSKKVQVA
jgi:hypothetical protein